MAGAGIDVDMAVAAPGRTWGAVLEDLGRWGGNEMMVPREAWSTTGLLSMAQLPTADCGRRVVLVFVGGEERMSHVC